MRDIGAIISVMHSEIGSLDWRSSQLGGYIDQMDAHAFCGTFIHPETTEAIQLLNDAKLLRELADKLLSCRDDLLKNVPQLQAAE